MDSILEHQRQLHEEIEILEEGIVEQYHLELKTQRERLLREHQVARYLDTLTNKCGQLQQSYLDEDGAKRREIEAISGATEFSGFYHRLKDIKDHHRRYPNVVADSLHHQVLAASAVTDLELDTLFSGEEAGGKYLDVHANFAMYINLRHDTECSYLKYLDKLDNFHEIPKSSKNANYRRYLEELMGYLHSFFQRAQPLVNYSGEDVQLLTQFEQDWASGKVLGWASDPEDAELYCEPCKKHFTKKTVFDAHLTGKRHIKAAQKLQTDPVEAKENGEVKENPNKSMAWMERQIAHCLNLLQEIREETKANVERKQSLTEREREIEQEVEEIELEGSDSDDDERIYNPLKLPLGWDGKPIPYWLYKLHGLGVEYPCEICGNFVYMGRKAFERHFQEWRHGHGMRCLGIPNTRHFHEITSIEDAYSLWERLKQMTKLEKMQSETMEEFEDDSGNVFNKKTYEDLKRQGLL